MIIKVSLLIFLLASCSTIPLDQKILSSNKDILLNESFSRYSTIRLNKASLQTDNLGVISCHKKEIKKGLTYLKNQYKERVNQPEYWNEIGTCYYLDNKYNKAEFSFALSIQRDTKSNYAPVYNNLALLSLQKGDFGEAFSFFEKSLSISPAALTTRYNLAQLYIQFNNFPKAKKILLNLHKLNSMDVDILSSLAMIHVLEGGPLKAMAIYKLIPVKLHSRANEILIKNNLVKDKKLQNLVELLRIQVQERIKVENKG
jgi:tetratricopeptide (TPR) repeat protein